MNTKKNIYFFLIAIIFYGCSNDENGFENVNGNYKFTTNGISPNDSIYIYNWTRFSYKFVDLEGKNVDIENIFFVLDNQKLTLYQDKFFEINPAMLMENGSTLEIIINLSKNAQQVKYDYKILRLENYNISITQDITSDNHLKLIWNKLPEYETLKIEKYLLSFRDEYIQSDVEKEIAPSDTFYVDNTYVYGDRRYKLEVVFEKNDSNETDDNKLFAYYDVQYEKYTDQDFVFSNVDANNVKIEWRKNIYDCIYFVEYSGWNSYSSTNQQNECSVEFDRGTFPLEGTMQMYIIPTMYDVSTKQYIYPIYYNYHDPFLYKYSSPRYMWGNTYDVDNKIIYFTNEDGLYSYNANDMSQISSVIFDRNYAAHISCSKTDSRIALNILNKIKIYNGANLVNPFTFQGTNAMYDSYPFFYMAGNFVVTCNNYDEKAYIYNSHTGTNLYIIPFDNNNTKVLLSPDGNYLVMYEPVHYGNIKIYQLTNETYTLIYEDNGWYIDYCEFDYMDNNILYFVKKNNNGYAVFNMSQLSVVEDKNTNYGRVDPFTGNRVCFESDNFVVYDNTKSRVLYKIRRNFFSGNAEIFNNFLFVSGVNGYDTYSYINLNELIE